MIEKEIDYIEMLANDLIKELREFDKDVEKEAKYCYDPMSTPNSHKASYERLRLEFNKKCIQLSKSFRSYRNYEQLENQ